MPNQANQGDTPNQGDMASHRPRKYALVTVTGTACLETALTAEEFATRPDLRDAIEHQYCLGYKDDPIAGSWVDVTENDAFYDNDDA